MQIQPVQNHQYSWCLRNSRIKALSFIGKVITKLPWIGFKSFQKLHRYLDDRFQSCHCIPKGQGNRSSDGSDPRGILPSTPTLNDQFTTSKVKVGKQSIPVMVVYGWTHGRTSKSSDTIPRCQLCCSHDLFEIYFSGFVDYFIVTYFQHYRFHHHGPKRHTIRWKGPCCRWCWNPWLVGNGLVGSSYMLGITLTVQETGVGVVFFTVALVFIQGDRKILIVPLKRP